MHAIYGRRGFCGFVLLLIGKMEIFPTLSVFQTNINIIRRYEGCYYTRLESYYIIFYFETDWSRIRPLPSTTLIVISLPLYCPHAHQAELAIVKMIFRKKHTNILLILLLQVLQCLCATHFVLLVEDSDRDSSLIKTVGASVDRINGDDTLLANQMLYFSTLQSMVSILFSFISKVYDFCIVPGFCRHFSLY